MPAEKLVRIVPHDPAWARRYADEAPKVVGALGDCVVAIEHVGSTAVPAVDAKPTIDILVGVGDLAEVSAEAEARMEQLGYELRGEMSVPGRRYFRKGPTFPRDFNVHVVELGARLWHDNIAFRDHLRANPQAARAYGDLKRKLLSRPDGAGLDNYAAGKSAFIADVLRNAG